MNPQGAEPYVGDWREKLRTLINEAAERCGVERPRIVVPKRNSGPRLSPSDWWDMDQQAKLQPQCNCCHERPGVNEMPLVRGLCTECRKRLDESPEAA